MKHSERIGVKIETINRVLGWVGLALVFGWQARIINEQGDVALHNVHLHPAIRKPTWWPK